MQMAEQAPRMVRLDRAAGHHCSGVTTPEAIRRTAMELFARNGFQATSLRKLAAAVGVQPGSLYVHFSTKEDLLVDLIEEYEDNLQLSLRHQICSYRGANDLDTYVAASLVFKSENREGTLLAFHEHRSLQLEQMADIVRLRAKRSQLLLKILEHHPACPTKELKFRASAIEALIMMAFFEHIEDVEISITDLISRTCKLVNQLVSRDG